VEVQQVGIAMSPELGGDIRYAVIRGNTDHLADIGVIAEKWSVTELRKHGYAGCGMSPANGAEERSDQEYIADGAEPDGQNVWRCWGVEHGVKVLR
jgi:hypothetical protein